MITQRQIVEYRQYSRELGTLEPMSMTRENSAVKQAGQKETELKMGWSIPTFSGDTPPSRDNWHPTSSPG